MFFGVFFFECVTRLKERERGKCPQLLHECVRPRRKGKGRTLSEMKVERNKRFGFNLVEGREGLHCAHWPKASRSLRKDCDKSSARKSNGNVQFDKQSLTSMGGGRENMSLLPVECIKWMCISFFLTLIFLSTKQ